jgi:hypothetical protein
MPTIKPAYKNLVIQTASQMRGRAINQDSLTRAFHSNKLLKNLHGMDIEALVALVMMDASKDTESDLKSMMADMKTSSQQKQTQRNLLTAMHVQQQKKKDSINNKKDSMPEINESAQLRLQMYADRRSKFNEIISNIMKKISSTEDQIISNMK